MNEPVIPEKVIEDADTGYLSYQLFQQEKQ